MSARSQNNFDGPARRAFDIDAAKHDTTMFTNDTRGIYVEVGGDVVMLFVDDESTVTMNLAAGFYPFALKRVNSTSTTATGIFGLY